MPKLLFFMNLSRDDSTVKQGIFFFLLSAQKKKKQKEKAPAAAPELKNRRISLNEKNSLRSNERLL